jgi:hypothetical protein
MDKIESTIVGTFLAVVCPLSAFVLLWWSAAAIHILGILPLSERGVSASAIIGLGVGLILDILFLNRFVELFCRIPLHIAAIAYLFWSAIAVAFFMGLPIGNLILGTLAGVYVGRRELLAGSSSKVFQKASKHAGIFTGLVTSTEALLVGLLAVRQHAEVPFVERIFGIKPPSIGGVSGILLVLFLCVILMMVQYWFTRSAAGIAFRGGRKSGVESDVDAATGSNGKEV